MFGFDFMSMVAGLPGLIIAMSVHEYAHARVAVSMGDFTPKYTGRLTLNPLAHIDPVGLIMLLIMQFGWAKPVMINPSNFRDRTKGEILVALAGPASNFLVAFIAMAFLIIWGSMVGSTTGLRTVFWLIIIYNINFGIFNLIPVPPLDGSRVLSAVLPYEMQYKLAGLERYSFLILIAIMMTPVLSYILIPIERLILSLYTSILSVLLGAFL